MITADFLFDVGEKIRSHALRAVLLSLFLVLSVNAAVFSLGREILSGTPTYAYRLFSKHDTAAADYVLHETESDALFLTANNHNNAVAALTGRNVYCGCPSYLFYHGLDYTERMDESRKLLTDADYFTRRHAELGIDYVYIGAYERALGCTEEYFALNFPAVFSSGDVAIYKTS